MKPLFIHIPKCGGMTVRHALIERVELSYYHNLPGKYAKRLKVVMDKHGEHVGYEHARWRDLLPEIRARHRCFALVRNPWARAVSRYTFAKHIGDRAGKQTFRQFLDERHEYGETAMFWHRGVRGWYEQTDHVTDEDGERRVDCLRLESDDLQRYLKLPGPLPRRNVSNTKGHDYREFYDNDCYEIIEDWYERDIRFFGFTFDGPATRNTWAKVCQGCDGTGGPARNCAGCNGTGLWTPTS